MNVLWAVCPAEGEGLMLVSDGRQSSRSFLDGDRIGWLVAEFTTGAGTSSSRRTTRWTTAPGSRDAIRGSFVLTPVSSIR